MSELLVYQPYFRYIILDFFETFETFEESVVFIGIVDM